MAPRSTTWRAQSPVSGQPTPSGPVCWWSTMRVIEGCMSSRRAISNRTYEAPLELATKSQLSPSPQFSGRLRVRLEQLRDPVDQR